MTTHTVETHGGHRLQISATDEDHALTIAQSILERVLPISGSSLDVWIVKELTTPIQWSDRPFNSNPINSRTA